MSSKHATPVIVAWSGRATVVTLQSRPATVSSGQPQVTDGRQSRSLGTPAAVGWRFRRVNLVKAMSQITANGQPVETQFPCTLEEFLVAQNLRPRSVVVEHNGEAVAPSEFARRPLQAGDRLEIVKIVAGG
jgi:thiamine biosynthesis protein ThiS